MTRTLILTVFAGLLAAAPASIAQVTVAPDSVPAERADRGVRSAGESLDEARRLAQRAEQGPMALERVRSALGQLDRASSAVTAEPGPEREAAVRIRSAIRQAEDVLTKNESYTQAADVALDAVMRAVGDYRKATGG